MYHALWIVPLVVAVAGIALLLWRRSRWPMEFAQVRARFLEDRPRLHAEFFAAASTSGKPRGLRWKECQWSDLIEWVRDKNTGADSCAGRRHHFVRGDRGGDMEGIEAVGNLRNASAVFFLQGGQWETAGRAVFNLNPAEAVDHFKGSYERII